MFLFFDFGNNKDMKKNLQTINDVKSRVEGIKGQEVELKINRGRKKLCCFTGKLIETYPSVFTINIPNSSQPDRSYSYTEVLCGNVKICPKTINI